MSETRTVYTAEELEREPWLAFGPETAAMLRQASAQARVLENTPTCPTCRHHEVDDKGDHWCALGISTAGRVPGLVTHLQPFGCSLHEGKETT